MVKKNVLIDGEEVDGKVVREFEEAVKELRENDSKHVIPDFLKAKVDVKKVVKEIHCELADELDEDSLFSRKRGKVKY